MKKKIVIIGANHFQNPLIEKAKDLGYETHVFAWKAGDIGEKTADYFYPISISEKERILEECKKIRPVAVASVGSDLAVLTVNYIARALGLPGNPEETDLWATNKFAMREAFERAGVSTPKHIKVTENMIEQNLAGLEFPLIVKPTDRSGSRAICKVHSFEETKHAVKNACKESFENCAIIEEVIYGNEYSCECISQDGDHHILTFTRKYTTDEPYYIETAHMEPSDLNEEQVEAAKTEIVKGLDALHITTGASHAEFRVNENGEVRIIEIGARMGGDYIGTHLVPLSTGCDFVKMVIDAACGNPIDLSGWEQEKVSYVRFIMNNADLDMLKTLRSKYPQYIRYISEIDEIGSRDIVDSSTRFGAFILQCENKNTLKQIIFDTLTENEEQV